MPTPTAIRQRSVRSLWAGISFSWRRTTHLDPDVFFSDPACVWQPISLWGWGWIWKNQIPFKQRFSVDCLPFRQANRIHFPRRKKYRVINRKLLLLTKLDVQSRRKWAPIPPCWVLNVGLDLPLNILGTPSSGSSLHLFVLKQLFPGESSLATGPCAPS